MKTRLKYKTAGALFALACLGVFAPQGSASADTSVSGWICVDLFEQVPGVAEYSSRGGITNESTTTNYTFGCPLIRELSDLDSVSVHVDDRSPDDELECIASEFDRYGFGSWSPTEGSGNGFLGYTTLTFSDGDLFHGASQSQYNVRCVVPHADVTNGASSIRSLRWTES